MASSKAKARRRAVATIMDCRATTKGRRIFADRAGPAPAECLGGSRYVAIAADDFTSYKVVKFLKKTRDATEALKSFTVNFNSLQELRVCAIRTDNGEEFEVLFHRFLEDNGIKHERTPPRRAPVQQHGETGARVAAQEG